MKRALVAVVVLMLLGGGYVAAAHLSGGAFPVPGLKLGGDRGIMRRAALQFWEDIQFKDFKKAASYHAPELQDTVDIPYLLQRLFAVKPEALDIMTYEVVFVDVDSSGNRGRVKTRTKVKYLASGEIREQELMLYFDRADARSPWFMKLEDSLRQLESTPGKKT